MASDGTDGAATGEEVAPAEPMSKNPQDQFMDVVDKAQASIPPEKYSKKALVCLDRDQAFRKSCIAMVEWPWFDRIIMLLILFNTAWMTLLTDPILSKKLADDDLANRVGGSNAATYDEVMGSEDQTQQVKMLSREYAAEAHSWAPLYRPFYDDCTLGALPPCSVNDVVELILLIVFTMEMAIKLVAYGLALHRNAYLRDLWNWLDFVVVVTGWLQVLTPGAGNLSALRTVKILRPLRALQRVRKLKVLANAITTALPALGSIGVILVFVCTTCGIIGSQLFMGTTRHTCYDCIGGHWEGDVCVGGDVENSGDICNPLCLRDKTNMITLEQETSESECSKGKMYIGPGCGPGPTFCTSLGNATLGAYRNSGPNIFRDEHPTLGKVFSAGGQGNAPIYWWTCRPNQQCRCGESGDVDPTCKMTDNPNFGANNFDNVFWASVTVFQAITLEGWVDAMYAIIDGSGVFAFVYFVAFVLFGACIILNLFLAVLCDNFAIAEDDPDVGEKEDEVDGEAEAANAAAALNHSNKFRAMCLELAIKPQFMYFITGCICLNAVLMMIKINPDGQQLAKYDYQPYGLFISLWVLNTTLTIIFTLESAIKMIGLGWKVFKMDSFNIFDLVVVFFSLVDVALDIPAIFYDVAIPPLFPVSVLRTFRIIRVLKLARSYESLRIILVTLTKSVVSVQYLCILMLLFILIFALLGMEFFGGRYPRPEYNYTAEYYPNVFIDEGILCGRDASGDTKWLNSSGLMAEVPYLDPNPPSCGPDDGAYTWGPDDGPSRYNFDSFGESFLSIFVILSGENWNEIWWDAHRSSFDDEAGIFGFYTATVYFFILFVFGNLVMFNLFIAILLSNFDEADDEEEEEGGEEEEDVEDDGLDAAMGNSRKSAGAASPDGGKNMPMMSYTFGNYRDPQEAEMRKSGHIKVSGDGSGAAADEEEKPRRKSTAAPVEDETGDRSCMLFAWNNPVRKGAHYLVAHPWFDPVIITLIVISSILLAIDDPRLDATDPLKMTIRYINYFFTAAFIIEMLLKIVVLGFIHSKIKEMPAYLRSGWNILDFCVVVISILSLMNMDAVQGLQALRTFRALRPLRLISRLEGMRQVINTLIKSIPAVSTLGVVMVLFFGIFDIIAMQLFGGRLGSCLDPLGVYTDSEIYVPGFECIEKEACTFQHITGFSETFPPADLYNRTVLAGAGADLLETHAAQVGCSCEVGTKAADCGSEVPCFQKMIGQTLEVTGGSPATIDVSFLTLIDYDRDGKINDYEECMSLPKYNLTRRDSLGRLLTELDSGDFDVYSNHPEMFYTFPRWVQPNFGNFDNFFYGFLLLFEVAALEGWPDVMFWVIDSHQTEQFVEPQRIEMHQYGRNDGGTKHEKTRYYGPANHLSNGWPLFFYGPVFFVIWLLFGSFIILNMVVGVVLDAYNRIKSEGSGTAFMTEGQAEWVATQRSVIAMRPLKSANPPTAQWRMWAYHLVTWNIFDLAIMGVIVSNMLFMCLDFYAPDHDDIHSVRDAIMISNLIFLIVYHIEMVLKWLGLGVKQYFKDPWNRFDFLLVLLSDLDLALSSTDGIPFPAAVVRVLRLFRVIRILRIFKTAKSLRAILMTIILSMPALYNVTMLMLLFIFIFAVFCTQLFAAVAYTELPVALTYTAPETYWFSTTSSYGDFINRHANFETFGMSLLTLVRCVTGESFNGVMHDTMDASWGDNMLRCCPTCGFLVDEDDGQGPQPVTSCGQSVFSVTIFVFYCIFMGFVILALIIGVILDNFANVGSENKAVTVEHIEEFREVWLRYDPKGTFIVPSHNLLAILQQLRQPLGIADRTPALSRAQMLQFLGELDIPDHGGSIHFLEALTALSHAVCGVPVPLCDATRGLQKAAQKVPKLTALEKPAHNALTNYLVSLLQSRWRGYAMRKKYSDHALGEVPPEAMQPPVPAALAEVPDGKVKTNQVAPAP